MTTNSQLSTTEPKKYKSELSKQIEQDQIHRNRDHIRSYQWGGGGGRVEENIGNKKHNTHGHELRGGMLKGSRGQCREEGDKGEKNMGQP